MWNPLMCRGSQCQFLWRQPAAPCGHQGQDSGRPAGPLCGDSGERGKCDQQAGAGDGCDPAVFGCGGRKKSLEIEQERLWALLEKADSLDAVVALEARLSEIRYELESYTSQLRLYDNQVDYSTVSIYIEGGKGPYPHCAGQHWNQDSEGLLTAV